MGQHRGAAADKGENPLKEWVADPGEPGVLARPSDELTLADFEEVPRFGKRGVRGEARCHNDRGRKACVG